MLVSFFLWPIFFIIGVLFGFLSPIVAICKACRQLTGKWQTYVRSASSLSSGHQKRIKALARCFLVCECFECSDENHLRGQRVFLNYYKLGHHIGFSFHIITITLVKVVLFYPFWTAVSASLEDLKHMDDGADLDEDLLRSRTDYSLASSRKERPSRNGSVNLRSVGANDPGATYRVESVQSGDLESPRPYIRPAEISIDSGRSAYPGHGRNYVSIKIEPSVSYNSQISNGEPWGDWGPAGSC